jgi:hypothetical protein
MDICFEIAQLCIYVLLVGDKDALVVTELVTNMHLSYFA